MAHLSIMEGFSVYITEWLLSGRADLARVYNREPLPAFNSSPAGRAAQPDQPVDAAPPDPLPLQDLPLYPLVLPQRGPIFRRLMETAAAFAQAQLNVAREVSSLPVILDLVSAGLDHAALGASTISSFAGHPERVAITRFQDADIKSTLCLITPAQLRTSPLLERTTTLLRELVQAPAMG